MAKKTFAVEPLAPLRVELEAKFFRGLGHPMRLRILEYLLEEDRNVGELVDLLGSPQGRVSSHLACLRWCGYVSSYREGLNVYYHIADSRVRQLLELARSIIADNAEAIWSCTRVGTSDDLLSEEEAEE